MSKRVKVISQTEPLVSADAVAHALGANRTHKKKDTYMNGPAQPYQRRSPEVELAKFLANTARRFIADKSSTKDIDKAIREWQLGKKPSSDVENFLDRFGCFLQACFNPSTPHGKHAMVQFRLLVGPLNAENTIEDFRKACVEFFGHEHEFFQKRG